MNENDDSKLLLLLLLFMLTHSFIDVHSSLYT